MTAGADTVFDALSRDLLESFPDDAARVLERFAASEIAETLADEPPGVAARVLRALATPIARDALACLSPARAASIVGELSAPWAAALLRASTPEQLDAVLAEVRAGHREPIARALAHHPQSIGAITDPAFLSLPPDTDAAFALDQIRERPALQGNRIYVADRDGRLVGVVGVADAVVASPSTLLGDIMVTDVATLPASADTSVIAKHPAWARWRTLPVVDREGALIGVVGYEAVQRFLLAEPPVRGASAISLPVSLAELFWLGLRGVTDGLARTVAHQADRDER